MPIFQNGLVSHAKVVAIPVRSTDVLPNHHPLITTLFFFEMKKKKKLLSNRQSPDCEYGLYGLTVYNFFGGSILLHVLNNCFFFCGFSILFPLSLKFLGL